MFGTIWQIDHVPQSLHSGIWPLQNLLVIGDSWQGFSCYGEQSLTLLESLVESHGKLDTEEWLLALCQQGAMILSGRTPNKSVFGGKFRICGNLVHVSHPPEKNRASNLRKDFAKRLEARFGKSSAYEVDAVDQECHIVRSTYHICLSYFIISYHNISLSYLSYHIISYHIISYHIISYHNIFIISYYIISYHDSWGFRDDRHHGHHVFNCVSRRRTGRSWRKIPPMPMEKSSRLRGNGRCLCPVLGVMAPSRQVEMLRCETSSSKLRTCLSGKIVELKRGTVILDVFRLRLPQVNCRLVENAGLPQTVRQWKEAGGRMRFQRWTGRAAEQFFFLCYK